MRHWEHHRMRSKVALLLLINLVALLGGKYLALITIVKIELFGEAIAFAKAPKKKPLKAQLNRARRGHAPPPAVTWSSPGLSGAYAGSRERLHVIRPGETLSRIAEAYDFSRPGVLERMTGLYPDSGRVVSASGGQVTASVDSLRAGITRFWTSAGHNMRDAHWEWGEVQVERLGPDAAVLTGTWRIPHIAPNDSVHVLEGAWTAVFRRINGDWKIVMEHLSAPAQ